MLRNQSWTVQLVLIAAIAYGYLLQTCQSGKKSKGRNIVIKTGGGKQSESSFPIPIPFPVHCEHEEPEYHQGYHEEASGMEFKRSSKVGLERGPGGGSHHHIVHTHRHQIIPPKVPRYISMGYRTTTAPPFHQHHMSQSPFLYGRAKPKASVEIGETGMSGTATPTSKMENVRSSYPSTSALQDYADSLGLRDQSNTAYNPFKPGAKYGPGYFKSLLSEASYSQLQPTMPINAYNQDLIDEEGLAGASPMDGYPVEFVHKK